jgi:glycerol-3-phosphate dehydrogenase
MPDHQSSISNHQSTDLLIIGGGIVGAGVARDAAMRGLSVVLVDKQDFAAGTSGRSSRLLHGGIRYLEQGRVRMVREASLEKMTLHKIAPHLAEPLGFVFPTYSGTRWWHWKMAIGVKVYDMLCGKRNFGRSSRLGKQAALAHEPKLQPDRLSGAVRYFDGFTNDARLVLDSLRSAAAYGATPLNYTAFVKAEEKDGDWICELRNERSGDTHTVTAGAVVNAAGVWSGDFEHSDTTLRPTKGVHLVVHRDRLPVQDAVVMPQKRRILFAIPWGERTILGTTDTDFKPPYESPVCNREDADYVLAALNAAFPESKLNISDVRSAYAGLRPLVAAPDGNPSDISREHEIDMPKPGWIDVTGGKLTTYRLMAEQTVDRLFRHSNRRPVPCRTADEPLVSEADRQFSGTLPPPVSAEAVAHYCANEWPQTLDDVMTRRAGWTYYNDDPIADAEKVVGWMAEKLDWDSAKQERQLEAYGAILQQSRENLLGGHAGA